MTNDTLNDLVSLAVQSKKWSWLPGMKVVYTHALGSGSGLIGSIIAVHNTDSSEDTVFVAWDCGITLPQRASDLAPVVAEDSTKGILLGLTRRAWNIPTLYAGISDCWYIAVPDLGDPSSWSVVTGDTEEEVILRAFLAAPKEA